MKKIVRLRESELVNLIKKVISEQVDPHKAAQGPQKCEAENARNKEYCKELKAQKKEDKKFEKEIKKQDEIIASQSEKEFSDYINPDYNEYDEKLDRKGKSEFQQSFMNFMSANPGLIRNEGGYTDKQIYKVLKRETIKLKSPSYYLRGRLKISSVLSEREVYDLISDKYGSFVSFIDRNKPAFN